MPDTKCDKYDEVSRLIKGKAYTHSPGGDYSGESDFDLDDCKDVLKSAFPPPAEDAQGLAEGIMLALRGNATNWPETTAYIAAVIESFAQSRVEPWREALEAFEAWWRLPNIARSIETIEPAMRKCVALLSDSPAKEAR